MFRGFYRENTYFIFDKIETPQTEMCNYWFTFSFLHTFILVCLLNKNMLASLESYSETTQPTLTENVLTCFIKFLI